ncbi:hypothetical protein HZU73_05938 [Apis mellifera caucasica]|nr:hypothetical protein HZU73_05938 [Apis mellifera caucasica]
MLKVDMSLILTSLSYILCTCIFSMKYFSFLFHIKDVKVLLDEIKKDWNSLKNIEELQIIHEYSKTTKGITICFVRLGIIATETTSMAVMQHLCGLLKIISFRISHTFVANIPRVSFTERNIIIRKKVMSIVYLHVKIKNYINSIQEKIIMSYNFLLLFSLIEFSISMYELTKSIISNNTNELISSLFFIICITIYGFIPNHFAQKIINHSSNIFIDAYNTECE